MRRCQIASLNVIVCTVMLACSTLPAFLQPAAIPTMTATIMPTETITPTKLPSTATPVPTLARPATPANLKLEIISCIPVYYGNFKTSGVWGYAVKILISWEDKSNNEKGFIIYKNSEEFKTVEANITKFQEYLEVKRDFFVAGKYEVQAYNDAGKSSRIDGVISYVCQ